MNSRRFTWSPHWRGRAAWPALQGQAAAGLVGSPLGRRTTGEDEATPARDKRFRKLCAPFHKYRATGKRPQITPPGGVGPVHCGISVPSTSALGHKQTKRHYGAMSALPPKADIERRDGHVRFVPKADSCTAANSILFDHLIGAREQRLPHFEF